MCDKIIKPDRYSNKANVFIDRAIGDGPGEISAAQFKQELAELNPDTELNVFFDSNGGGVSDTKEIYRTFRGHRGPTIALVQGLCASSASVLAQGCDRIFMASDALYMIHNPHWSTSRSEAMCSSTGGQKLITIPREFNKQMPITIPTRAKGKNASVRRTIEENKRTIKKHRDLLNQRKTLLAESKEFILDVYVLRTGACRNDLQAMMDAGSWVPANDALNLGMVDSITGPCGMVSQADYSQYINAPALSGKYLTSWQTARANRSRKVSRQNVSYMKQQAQKILTQTQQA